MWNRVGHWASTAIVLALLFWFLSRPLRLWDACVLFVALGLAHAAVSAAFYLSQPPSRARFKGLGAKCGSSICIAIVASILLFAQLSLPLDPIVHDFFIIALFIAFVMGAGVFVAWFRISLQTYGRPKLKNPDYSEDEDANPVCPDYSGVDHG